MPSDLGKGVDKVLNRKIKFSRYNEETKSIGLIRKAYLKTDDMINGRTSRNESMVKINNRFKYISEDKQFLKRKVTTTIELKTSRITGKEFVVIRQKRLFSRTKIKKVSLKKYERITNPKNTGQKIRNYVDQKGKGLVKKGASKTANTIKNSTKQGIKTGVLNVSNSDDSIGNKMITQAVELPSRIKTAKTTTKTIVHGSKKVVKTTWNGTKYTAKGIKATGKATLKTAKKVKTAKKTYKNWVKSREARKKMYKAGVEGAKGISKLVASLGKVVISNFPVVAIAVVVIMIALIAGNALLAVTSAIEEATYSASDESLSELYDYIVSLDSDYSNQIANIQTNWKSIKGNQNVLFNDYTTSWDGNTINSFTINNKYNPYSQTEAMLDYISAEHVDESQLGLLAKVELLAIWSNCNKLYMTVSQKNDYSNPIYANDETKPIYGNDESRPIYGNDYSNPKYTDPVKFNDYGESFTSCKRSAYMKSNSGYETIFSEPSASSGDTLIRAYPSDTLEVIGLGDTWMKVKLGGYTGYTREQWFSIGSEQIIGYGDAIVGYEQKIVGYEQKIVGYKQLYDMDITMKGTPTEYYIEHNLLSTLTTEKQQLYDAYKEIGGMSMRAFIESPFDQKTLVCMKKRYVSGGNDMTLLANQGWKVKASMSGLAVINGNGNGITILNNFNGQPYIVKITNINPSISTNTMVVAGNDIGTVANDDGLTIIAAIDGKPVNPKMYMAREMFDFSNAYGTTRDEGIDKFISTAQSYLGYFYYFGGKVESSSFDCSGFVCWALQKSGYRTGINASAQGLYQLCNNINSNQVKAGDLIFFQGTYSTSDTITHVGIVIDPVNKIMLHCGDPIQYASYNTDYWNSHFYAYGRIK